MKTHNRVVSAYQAWDRFVAQCAQEGLTVDPTEMTSVLSVEPRPVRWEWLRGGVSC